MKLTICNGTPKFKDENFDLLLNEFIRGYSEIKTNKHEKYQLNKFENIYEMISLIDNADYFIIAFPLHAHSIPSLVKDLIERTASLCNTITVKNIGFIVQYGFLETTHARNLEKYLKRVAYMLNTGYLGTILVTSYNNLTNNELKISRKIVRNVYNLGKFFGETGVFNNTIMRNAVRGKKLNLFSKFVIKLILNVINHCYWGEELKLNGAYSKSFYQPYGLQDGSPDHKTIV